MSGGPVSYRDQDVRHPEGPSDAEGRNDGGTEELDRVGDGTGAGWFPHVVGLEQGRRPATPCNMAASST